MINRLDERVRAQWCDIINYRSTLNIHIHMLYLVRTVLVPDDRVRARLIVQVQVVHGAPVVREDYYTRLILVGARAPSKLPNSTFLTLLIAS